MELIELYKEWMETGKLPKVGLCFSLPKEYRKTLEMFKPDECSSGSCWGCPEYSYGHPRRKNTFTETRQFIVLFICAMHDEL